MRWTNDNGRFHLAELARSKGMRARFKRGHAARTTALALFVGALALGIAPVAHSQPAKAASGESASDPSLERPIDDALTGLFNADGSLAIAGDEGHGPAMGRKAAPPPPPPTDEQVRALEQLQIEADKYRDDARDYRDTITGIVKQHYEERRRRVLSSLDREISTERRALEAARADAIKRLENFIATYSGPSADPTATPNAMFRLAALYDEKARATMAVDISADLKPAVALYKRIIREFPEYDETAAVYYYLGHALFDSNRLDEAQQVWRSLVCHNLYPYPVETDPADPDKDVVGGLPQDHDDDYWIGWRHRFPSPESLKGNPKTPRWNRPKVDESEGAETSYSNPFPDSCEYVKQNLKVGEDPRYVAEIWWKIGDWYFDETDPKAGPYSFNRSVTAYQRSMDAAANEKGVLYGVSMYKLAWTYFKQQRYEAATRQFVDLLGYTDEMEQRTGDPGADFRAEAYTYIAGSLTYVDFAGPGPEEPFIPRSDVLDLESDPTIIEEKMKIAIERVQDPNLIPQDKPWTFQVYKALALEYKELNQLHNRIDLSEKMLAKWPMHREAPEIQAGIADTYEELTRMSREGTVERKENASKALEARSKLAAYVGNTPWVDANRDDPEALQIAERLVLGGLQRAAAEHTNRARAFLQEAEQMGDEKERNEQLERTLAEFKLAERAWAGYLNQDENAPDAYESRYWLADARHWIVHTKVLSGQTPTVGEVLRARKSAVEVRDSNEDDRRLEPAAYFAVNLAFLVRDDRYRVYDASNGAQGLKERTEVEIVGEGENQKVVKSELPATVRFLNLSQEEYIKAVPDSLDVNKRAPMFGFQVAESFFFYGQFEEAKKRYEPIYEKECGKSDFGYKAWERLLTMSNLEGDVEQSTKLAEAQKTKSCAVSEEQKTAETLLINPTLQEAAYRDARKAFEQAQTMPDGPERDATWRKAAALYRKALENAPDRREAPEAAMNGAIAYKQVGEYDKAIGMYELFINKYGDEKTLTKLEKGDPKAEPPVGPDPEKYAERVKYLKNAHDALSESYVLFFNYRRAAEQYDTISQIDRFEQKDRREAAKLALTLYANMGDKAKAATLQKRFLSLGPSAEERAEAEFIVARGEMNEWDERGRDEGANRAARQRALTAMTTYHARNKNKSEAAKYVVVAAYNAAKLHKAGGSGQYKDWYKNTISAFEKWKAVAPKKDGQSSALSTPEAAMAGEAEYTLLDQEIRDKFDYDTGHHRYKGTTVDVIKDYRADAADAKKYHDRLQHVIDAYVSPEWAVAARSRQGSLYDSLRSGLYNARPPTLELFSKKEETLLKKLEASDNPDHQDKADQFRQNRQMVWRQTRDRELADADKIMVLRYTEAVALGRKYNISNPAIDRAVERLAFFTDVLGDEKLREYSQGVAGFTYTEKMFLRSRPGIINQPEVDPVPNPLPVVP